MFPSTLTYLIPALAPAAAVPRLLGGVVVVLARPPPLPIRVPLVAPSVIPAVVLVVSGPFRGALPRVPVLVLLLLLLLFVGLAVPLVLHLAVAGAVPPSVAPPVAIAVVVAHGGALQFPYPRAAGTEVDENPPSSGISESKSSLWVLRFHIFVMTRRRG